MNTPSELRLFALRPDSQLDRFDLGADASRSAVTDADVIDAPHILLIASEWPRGRARGRIKTGP